MNAVRVEVQVVAKEDAAGDMAFCVTIGDYLCSHRDIGKAFSGAYQLHTHALCTKDAVEDT